MRDVVIKVYTFDELSDKAKEKVREKYRYINTDSGTTAEDIIAEFSVFLDIIGVSGNDIQYSGFSSQGDGLSFTGSYSYKKKWKENVVKSLPWFLEEFKEETEELQELQKNNLFLLTAEIARMGYNCYVHENSVSVTLGDERYSEDTEEKMKKIFRSLMQKMYQLLEKYWESDISDENVDESIRINEYEFTSEGERI